MKKILLIDGSSLLFRAFYAIRNLTTKDGVFVNGVYGFLNMYYKALDLIEPTHVLVAFDRGSKTFRHESFADYKGTRSKAPDEISYQFGILKDLLDSMNIKHIDMDTYEADDILGTVAYLSKENGFEVEMFTGDRDYLQLVDDDIRVHLTKKGITDLKVMTVESVIEEYGVKPKQLMDVKALQGDTSDNIPGVKGVGEKTALKLIADYGSLEGIYENISDFKGKLKENLENEKDKAYLSRMLGEICLNVPIEYNLDEFLIKEPNLDEYFEKLKKLEFESIINKVFSNKKHENNNKVEEKIEFELLSEGEVLNLVKDEEEFAIKFFSEEKYIYRKKFYLGIFLPKLDKTCIIKEFSSGFLEILFNSKSNKIGYDIKEEIYTLLRMGISFDEKYEDVMILEYLLDSNKGKYDISSVSKEFLGLEIQNIEDITGKGKSKKDFFYVEDDIIFNFIAQNVNSIYKIYKKLNDKIDEDTMNLYNIVEKPLVSVLAEMENNGVVVDCSVLKKLKDEYEKKAEDYEAIIYKLAGEDFNINSPKQLGVILFDKLRLPVIKKTKTGYSTDVEVLEKLSEEHEIADVILKYRSLKKLISTYLEALMEYVMEDGRIRSFFKQTVAATGRLSSVDPNLQNIPIRTEEGRNIRKAFVSPKNYLLVDADYSQIELRVLAHLANDTVMIDSFKHNLDIHAKTASEVFGVDISEVNDTQRRNAKAVNFGIVYGISDYGLSKDLNITRKEAKQYIDGYLNTYTDIKDYMDSIIKLAKKEGFVTTILGRKRFIPEISSSNFNIRSFGERMALNTPIQGSAADIIKLAMISIYKKLKEQKIDAKLILQVHDELIIECRKEDVDNVSMLLKESMENVFPLNVPLSADVNKGENWFETK